MRKIIEDALGIDELQFTLDNVATDTKRAFEEIPDEEIVSEAEYVLSTFFEGGHINNAALNGEDDGEYTKAWARGQVRKLKAFIKKYKTTAAVCA
jgi:hypothetical protein